MTYSLPFLVMPCRHRFHQNVRPAESSRPIASFSAWLIGSFQQVGSFSLPRISRMEGPLPPVNEPHEAPM